MPGYGGRWPAARKRALARAGHRCEKCGSASRLEVHHKEHRKDGGGHALRNLIVLCRRCHFSEHKGNAARAEWKELLGDALR